MFDGQLQGSACVLDHTGYLEESISYCPLVTYSFFRFNCYVIFFIGWCYGSVESVGSLRPTWSGVMLWTGMPLTSSTRSPLWTEDSRSGLRAAVSNLRETDNELTGAGKVGEDKTSLGCWLRLALTECKVHSWPCLGFRDSPCHSDKRAFLLAEVSGESQGSSATCTGRERHQRHHVGTLGEWRS